MAFLELGVVPGMVLSGLRFLLRRLLDIDLVLGRVAVLLGDVGPPIGGEVSGYDSEVDATMNDFFCRMPPFIYFRKKAKQTHRQTNKRKAASS